MTSLQKSHVQQLREEFASGDDELSLEEFVAALIVCLKKSITKETEVDFVREAIELFRQIDVNGDGGMEWDELAAFIFEAGIAQDNEVGSWQSLYTSQKSQITAAYSISKLFYLPTEATTLAVIMNNSDSLLLYDLPILSNLPQFGAPWASIRHSRAFKPQTIVSCCLIPLATQDYIATLSEDGPKGDYFLNIFTLEKSYKRVAFSEPTSRQYSLCWVDCVDTLYCGGNGAITAYKFFESQVKNGDEFGNGSSKAKRVSKKMALERSAQLLWHSASVTCLAQVPDNLRTHLLSGSMDGTIGVWNVYNNQQERILVAHEMGVRSMQYSPNLELLVTTGYGKVSVNASLWATVWHLAPGKPDASVIDNLKGHKHPLLSAAIVEKQRRRSPYEKENAIKTFVGHSDEETEGGGSQRQMSFESHIITADSRGTIRVWHVEMIPDTKEKPIMTCVQILKAPHSILGSVLSPRLTSFIALPPTDLVYWYKVFRRVQGKGVTGSGRYNALSKLKMGITEHLCNPPQIVVGGKGAKLFELQDLSDCAYPLLKVLYSTAFDFFITLSSHRILIFNAADGKMRQSFTLQDLCKNVPLTNSTDDPVFTDILLDGRHRKLIVSLDNGEIRIHNLLNGAFMKHIDPHEAHVSAMAYSYQHNAIISTGWDCSVHIADEADNNGYNAGNRTSVLLRKVSLKIGNSENNGSIGISTNPPVDKKNIESSDITCVTSSDSLGLIAISTRGKSAIDHLYVFDFEFGTLAGMCIRQNIRSMSSASPLMESKEKSNSSTARSHLPEFTALAFVEAYQLLLSADASGEIYVWYVGRTGFGKTHPFDCLFHFSNIEMYHATKLMERKYVGAFMTASQHAFADDAGVDMELSGLDHEVENVKLASVLSLKIILPSELAKQRNETTFNESENDIAFIAWTGDDHGDLKQWNISKGLLAGKVQDPFEDNDEVLNSLSYHERRGEAYNARRVLEHTYTSGNLMLYAKKKWERFRKEPLIPKTEASSSSDNLKEPETKERARTPKEKLKYAIGLIRRRLINPKSSWSAHNDWITSLEVLYQRVSGTAVSLLTSSRDTTAKIWALDGTCLGIMGIDQGITQQVKWRYDPGIEERRADERAEAKEVLVRLREMEAQDNEDDVTTETSSIDFEAMRQSPSPITFRKKGESAGETLLKRTFERTDYESLASEENSIDVPLEKVLHELAELDDKSKNGNRNSASSIDGDNNGDGMNYDSSESNTSAVFNRLLNPNAATNAPNALIKNRLKRQEIINRHETEGYGKKLSGVEKVLQNLKPYSISHQAYLRAHIEKEMVQLKLAGKSSYEILKFSRQSNLEKIRKRKLRKTFGRHKGYLSELPSPISKDLQKSSLQKERQEPPHRHLSVEEKKKLEIELLEEESPWIAPNYLPLEGKKKKKGKGKELLRRSERKSGKLSSSKSTGTLSVTRAVQVHKHLASKRSLSRLGKGII
eukprot:g3940.t1